MGEISDSIKTEKARLRALSARSWKGILSAIVMEPSDNVRPCRSVWPCKYIDATATPILLLFVAGCVSADMPAFSSPGHTVPAIDVIFSEQTGVGYRFVPPESRWDAKILGQLTFQATQGPPALIDVRKIRRGYALDYPVLENENGLRWSVSGSYGQEHDGMLGVGMRWAF